MIFFYFRMSSLVSLSTLGVFLLISICHSYSNLDSITDSLLREVVGRMEGPEGALVSNFDDYGLGSQQALKPQPEVKDFPTRNYEERRDTILGREPSIRDKEFLEHSTLFGKQSIQGMFHSINAIIVN